MESRNQERESPPFEDRRHAGRLLAALLHQYCDQPAAIVLGIPRGGAAVAVEIARALRLPLDVVASRKIGAPGEPELAVGAIAEGGEPYVDESRAEITGTPTKHIAETVARERTEIVRRQDLFREGKPLRLPSRATAILVDDGVLSGCTMFAAIQALRGHDVRRLVVAVPVARADTVEVLRSMVDEVIVLEAPLDMTSLSDWYGDFREVEDAEVCSFVEGAL